MASGFGSDDRLNGKKVAGARNYDDHYLQLDQNETDLIQYVGDKFDNVIVLFNTGSQFEAGFLDDPGHYAYHKNIKGAMWIGYPGNGNGLERSARTSRRYFGYDKRLRYFGSRQ